MTLYAPLVVVPSGWMRLAAGRPHERSIGAKQQQHERQEEKLQISQNFTLSARTNVAMSTEGTRNSLLLQCYSYMIASFLRVI